MCRIPRIARIPNLPSPLPALQEREIFREAANHHPVVPIPRTRALVLTKAPEGRAPELEVASVSKSENSGGRSRIMAGVEKGAASDKGEGGQLFVVPVPEERGGELMLILRDDQLRDGGLDWVAFRTFGDYWKWISKLREGVCRRG
jgi:hypothetical protein